MAELFVNPLPASEVRKLAEEDQSLYVMNTSDRKGTQPRGDLHISVNTESGDTENIMIPNTWIPFNMARYGSVKFIGRSKEFLDIVNKRNVVVIATADAEQILKTPQALEEAKIITEKYPNIGIAGILDEKISIPTGNTVINERRTQPSEMNVQQAGDQVETENDKRMRSLMQSYAAGTISEGTLIAEMNGMMPPPNAFVLQDIASKFRMSPSLMHAVGEKIAGSEIPAAATSQSDIDKFLANQTG